MWWRYHILHSNQCTFHVWPTWSGNELSKWQTSVIQSVTNIHLEISNARRRPSERNVEFPTVSKLYSCKSTDDDDDGEYASIMKTITILMLRTMMVTMFMMMMKNTEKIIMKWDRLPQQVLRHGNSQVVSITTLLHSLRSLYHCISFEMMMQMLMRTMVMTIDSFQARCWKWRQKTGQSNYALDKPVKNSLTGWLTNIFTFIIPYFSKVIFGNDLFPMCLFAKKLIVLLEYCINIKQSFSFSFSVTLKRKCSDFYQINKKWILEFFGNVKIFWRKKIRFSEEEKGRASSYKTDPGGPQTSCFSIFSLPGHFFIATLSCSSVNWLEGSIGRWQI